ncbi:MAG: ABC transporter permease [Gemmatimonadaceae bacterium]
MRQLRAAAHRIAGLFGGRRADTDLREEFESHVVLQTAENIRRGMAPNEARRQALIASGGLVVAVESVRERRGLPWAETLLADVRYGVRSLRRSPAFTVVAAITLALGIGANTAIFSVVNGVVLHPLPYPDPDRLVSITSTRNGVEMAVSVRDFVDWREQSKTFTGLAAGVTNSTILTGSGEPERLSQARVTANTLDVLSIRPVLGRAFLAGEDEESAPRIAMLSEGLWRRRFGGDSTVVGRALVFDGFPTTVVGIAPAGLQWPEAVDVWMTTRFTQNDLSQSSRGARWLSVIGRVGPATPLTAARAEMDGVARRLAQFDPRHNTNVEASVTPLLASLVGEIQRPLFVLLGAVGFVLLIACANVASLSLGRVAARDSELAVRAALGAGRGRLARQILTESLLLAIAGGALGLLLAFAGMRALVVIAPADLPRLDEVTLDGSVLAFTFAITLVTGVLFGVVPALQGAATELHGRLRAAGRGALGGKGNARSRRALVVAEMALAIVLLAGAGLLLRSFALLRDVDPGFVAERVVTFGVALPPDTRYAAPEQQRQFTASLLDGIARAPGVSAAAMSFALPLSGDNFGFTFEVLGRAPAPADNEPRAQARVASAKYFAAMGIPLIRGRLFDERDREGGRQVLVISAEVARRYFAGEEPIGKYLQTGWGMDGKRYGGEVIGVVGDVRQVALDQDRTPHMYMSYEQWPLNEYDVIVRSTAPPAVTFSAARSVLKQLDGEIPMNGARPLADIVDRSLGPRRFYLTLLTAFAAVAMALALVGIYGVIAYGVQQRRREIGIRLALGASHHRVVGMVLSEGLRLVAAGVVLGMVGALALTRLLDALLFQVGARDQLTFAVAPALLTLAAALACLLPARRAARQNPAETIRAD